ncbi:MAG: nucleotidyltransferase domain-containing protein [Nanoarchaeota archaeon]
MPSTSKLLKEVSNDLRPEGIPPSVEPFLATLNSSLRKNRYDAKAIAGGSIAKGTFLKEQHDIDIFVLFGKKHHDQDLSKLLEKVMKPFRPQRLHGSRDYFLVKRKINFEVVPVLKVQKPSQAKNITDVSPHHVTWVKKHLKKHPKLADDIRLAKQFNKAICAYGAESFIGGFSGHVIDILIIYYGGFIPLLKEAVKWKLQQVIDPENAHKGKALFMLNKSKLSPLIVIDPLQPERNAAAALTEEKKGRFSAAAKAFLKKPRRSFFELPSITLDKKSSYIIFDATPKAAKHDVAGARLRIAFGRLIKESRDKGFKVKQAVWEGTEGKSMFLLSFRPGVLSNEVIIQGPKTAMTHHAERFKRKHRHTFIKRGTLFATEKRKIKTLTQLNNYLLSVDVHGVKLEQGEKQRKNPQKSLCVHNIVDLLLFKSF